MEQARSLLLKRLNETAKAGVRLAGGGDSEALHDFRVGLRRLLTQLKAYGADKPRRRLRRVLSRTSPVRDAEIQAAWIKEHRELAGLGRLERSLREERREGLKRIREKSLRKYWRVDNKLRGMLKDLRTAARDGVLRPKAERLGTLLADLRDPSDPKRTHKLRLCVKTVRYLLEPMNQPELVARLKVLQELLGNLHDRNEFALRLAKEPGLEHAAKALQEERASLIKELRAWLKKEGAKLPSDILRLLMEQQAAHKGEVLPGGVKL